MQGRAEDHKIMKYKIMKYKIMKYKIMNYKIMGEMARAVALRPVSEAVLRLANALPTAMWNPFRVRSRAGR